jgi:hypothetical protein
MTSTSVFDKLFRDKKGNIVVFQSPNLPITGWLFCVVIGYYFSGPVKNGLFTLGNTFLFLWAYLEITEGVNYFRRFVGGLAMLYVLTRFFI